MNVIILGCHKGLTRGVVKSLINKKIRFIFLGTKELINTVSLSKLCISSYEIEEEDLELGSISIYEKIKTLMKNDLINYVIPTGIRSTLYISKHAKEIGRIKNYYPISDYSTLAMLNNKWNFYQFLVKNHIPTPKTSLLDMLEIEKISNDFHFPVITKPLDSENSNNVVKSNDINDLFQETIKEDIPLLVQEFIPGHDINLCIYSKEGEIRAWTINRRTDHGIIFDKNQEILSIGEKIVQKLNYSGLIHFDLRFNEKDGTISVLECNPRVWASMLHSAYVGVNFMELAITNEETFNEIPSGTISLNKYSLLKKLLKLSFCKKDMESVFIQTKLFLLDPFYELNFFMNNK